MKLYKIAAQDVVSSNREIVLIKDKQYLVLLDESSGQYYFLGENGRAYLLGFCLQDTSFEAWRRNDRRVSYFLTHTKSYE